MSCIRDIIGLFIYLIFVHDLVYYFGPLSTALISSESEHYLFAVLLGLFNLERIKSATVAL